MTATFPCFVQGCPWEASLRDGVWLCEKHDQADFVWDEESRVIWPKIAEMDRRIREATKRIIQAVHRDSDAFEMFMALTEAALGYEKTAAEIEKRRPAKGGSGGVQ